MSHESLTPAEAERLHLLIEECGETIQAAAKALRHGYESYDPTVARSCRETNRQALEYELGHIYAAVMRMTMNQDVDPVKINASREIKLERGGKWMHHQPDTPDWEHTTSGIGDPRPLRRAPAPAINLEVTMDPAVAAAIRGNGKPRCQEGGENWQCTRDEGHEGACAAIRRER